MGHPDRRIPLYESVAAFEKGLVDNDPNIAPSQIYAYAALKEGVPFANGAPNLTVDLPGREDMPLTGPDLQATLVPACFQLGKAGKRADCGF